MSSSFDSQNRRLPVPWKKVARNENLINSASFPLIFVTIYFVFMVKKISQPKVELKLSRNQYLDLLYFSWTESLNSPWTESLHSNRFPEGSFRGEKEGYRWTYLTKTMFTVNHTNIIIYTTLSHRPTFDPIIRVVGRHTDFLNWRKYTVF